MSCCRDDWCSWAARLKARGRYARKPFPEFCGGRDPRPGLIDEEMDDEVECLNEAEKQSAALLAAWSKTMGPRAIQQIG